MPERPPGPILVTGASGFVGGAIVSHLSRRGHLVRACARTTGTATVLTAAPSLSAEADWSHLLTGCDAIIHAAARVHVLHDRSSDPLAEFRAVNVEGTLRLARQAEAAGVRRFVFISSVKVNGEQSAPGRPFTAEDPVAPVDAYGRSKAEAEDALRALAARGMELVIIRPPLIHGPGVKANFRSLIRWVERGVPLPLGDIIHNRRSFVGLDNLVDLVESCLVHPSAAHQTFMVSDGEDVSTADLLRRLAAALEVPARLVRVPIELLRTAGRLVGREATLRRLCEDLQVDDRATRRRLGWAAPMTLDEGLRRLREVS